MRLQRLRTLAVLGGGVILLCGLVAGPASADEPAYTVVASGLNNPRNLTTSPDGGLYVAEAGTGGPQSDSCFVASAGANVCPGDTGSITKITAGAHGWHQQRVLTGLPSLAPPPGSTDPRSGADTSGTDAAGPSGLVVTGQRYTVAVGFGAGCGTEGSGGAGPDPSCNPAAEHSLSPLFGTLVSGAFPSHSGPRVLADIATHEFATNPIDNPDSNPVFVSRSGSNYVVADAGGNTIVRASASGQMTTVAQFPSVMVQNPFAPEGVMMPMQFVATSAVQGPDGALYVSQLTGFPFPQGGSTIWRVQAGHAPTAYATGLTNVTSLAFAPDGSLYAVEIYEHGLLAGGPGALVHIPRGGGTATVVAGGLPAPYGVALQAGSAYVTTNSSSPSVGQVIRIPLGADD
ncbi:ScyD/ScyE family protein [Microbacterium kribbense]|uniref:ScyD/ScyE family protein n=1 Tax=Microbacterium kribbense TaxID=433645 RepID=A0ABP7GQV0_9MICO